MIDKIKEHLDNKEFQAALDCLVGQPESAETLCLEARAHFLMHRYDKALQAASRSLELEPDHIEANLMAGKIWRDSSDEPEKCLPHFDKVISNQPDHVSAIFNRAQALCNLSRLDEAAIDAQRLNALGKGQLVSMMLGPRIGQAALDKAKAQLTDS